MQEHKEEINRLRRIEGQVRGLQKMVEEERDCTDIFIQFSSIAKAMRRVEEKLFHKHFEKCITDVCKSKDKDLMSKKLNEAVSVLKNFRNY